MNENQNVEQNETQESRQESVQKSTEDFLQENLSGIDISFESFREKFSLTKDEAKFCVLYGTTLDATGSYAKTFKKSERKRSTIQTYASALLKDLKIKDASDFIINKSIKLIKQNSESLIRRLMEISGAKFTDIAAIKDGELHLKDTDDMCDIGVSSIKSVKMKKHIGKKGVTTTTDVNSHDPLKAIDLLSKFVWASDENQLRTTNVTLNIKPLQTVEREE